MCVCVSIILPGLGGEVLTEILHNIKGFCRGSSQDASGCLETQVCLKSKNNNKNKNSTIRVNCSFIFLKDHVRLSY